LVTLAGVPADEVPAAAALEAALGLAGALDELDEPLLHAAAVTTVTVRISPIA
jgi:hypothetical protein